MSITKELREWFESGYVYEYYGDGDGDFKKVTTPWFGWRTVIEGMLDRIDEEHERVRAESIIDMTDESMAEHGWVKLPVDADGVPIQLGDELECIAPLCPGVPKVFKVDDMLYQGADNWHLRAYPATYDPKECRHHHKLTVEGMLREFALACEDAGNSRPAVMRLAEEYAAKLQLRED